MTLSLVNSVSWNVPLTPTCTLQKAVWTGIPVMENSSPLLRMEPMLVISLLPKFEPIGTWTELSRSLVSRMYASMLPLSLSSKNP